MRASSRTSRPVSTAAAVSSRASGRGTSLRTNNVSASPRCWRDRRARRDSLFKKENGFVQVRDSLCVGCQYCLSACPFGAPQFPDSDTGAAKLFGNGGTMDKCTMCEERQDVGKGPACAEECATDAILVGTTEEISGELDRRGSGTFFNDVSMEIIFGEEGAEVF
jgi:formate dehydrogenase iron-sulfur subunit